MVLLRVCTILFAMLCTVRSNYTCLCSFGVAETIYDQPSKSSSPIGVLYDFDCKASYTVDGITGFEAVGMGNELGFVANSANVGITQCDGSSPEYEKVTSTTLPTTTSTISTTQTQFPEGHVELCPDTIRDDIQRNHGDLQQFGDYCYEFVPYKTQWKNAERHCNIVSNGHLVSIMSQTEQDFILRFLKSHNHVDSVWIGLTDLDAEGTWQWSSGKPVSYTNFQHSFSWHTINEHRLDDCIVLQSNGEWVDLPCGVALFVGTGFGEAHSYVCQYNLTARPTDIFHGALAPFIVG